MLAARYYGNKGQRGTICKPLVDIVSYILQSIKKLWPKARYFQMEHNALIILKHRGTLINIKIQRKMIPTYFLFQLVVSYFRFSSEAIGADIGGIPSRRLKQRRKDTRAKKRINEGADVVICDR